MSEASFHQQFLATLQAGRDGEVLPPAWRVYANTGLLASMEAVLSNYPTVATLLGPVSARAMAGAYVRDQPPHDGRLFLYGAGLPAWLRAQEGSETALVLAAQLDRYWTECHSEADAPPLALSWLVGLDPQALASVQLRPAPATRWLMRPGLRLADWWQALRASAQSVPPLGGTDQAILLTRPDDAVVVTALPPAGAVLLQACGEGLSLADALARASDCAPETELQALLATLFAAGALQHPDQFTARALP